MSRPVEADDLTGIKSRIDYVHHELKLLRLLREAELMQEGKKFKYYRDQIARDTDLQAYYENP